MCRVEFFKIGKRDVTFIKEMRVSKQTYKMILVILDNQDLTNEVTKICNEPGIRPKTP